MSAGVDRLVPVRAERYEALRNIVCAAIREHADAFSVTFQGRPITGRNAGPGLVWSEGLCRSHVDDRTRQVAAEGGHVVQVREVNGQGVADV